MRHCPSLFRPLRSRRTAAAFAAAASLCFAASCSSMGGGQQSRGEWADGTPIPVADSRRDEVERKYFARQGFFVGGAAVATTLSESDFDGSSTITIPSTGNQYALPKLDPGLGWGIAVGYRGKENSIQYTYTATEHDDEFGSSSLTDDIKTYSLDFKHYWNVDGAFQPFLLLGITVPRVQIKQGVVNGGNSDTAVYQGLGANLGAGAALYLTPRIALFGEGFYRWAYLEDVRGLGATSDLDHRLDGSGFGVRGGISFTF